VTTEFRRDLTGFLEQLTDFRGRASFIFCG